MLSFIKNLVSNLLQVMPFSNSKYALVIASLLPMFMVLLTIPVTEATTFSFPNFGSNQVNITLVGAASSSGGRIDLTSNQRDVDQANSAGRAVYSEEIRIWDSTTGRAADFSTNFSFRITRDKGANFGGDGMTFFLAPDGMNNINLSLGGCLGIINNCGLPNSSTPVVAIEFDTFPNDFDHALSGPNSHVGIDINSIRSTVASRYDFLYDGKTSYNVFVDYKSSTQNLVVYINGSSKLSLPIDLKNILPEWVNVGFSASTGEAFEVQTLLSWSFKSTEFPAAKPKYNTTEISPDFPAAEPNDNTTGISPEDKSRTALVVGLTVGISLLVGGVCLLLFMWLKKKRFSQKEEEHIMSDVSSDDEYESKTGPRRFLYSDLVRATKNFTEDGKLGEGGFGGVYRGLLEDSNIEVAVKRISEKSRQGKKEFVSEVKIISQLRHRNLVELLGWCHEKGKLLLVYEFMPNGSLDFHLFGGRTMLTWVLRYKIAVGLASGLLYLHEEREQAVVHRDIKSSNIMLDSNFNTKLGDFGLARFADHDMGVKTTMLGGTMGYMAPECMSTGKAGKESDVYSFGVVALEIACGRRSVEPKNELGNFGLVGWAWELYGSGRLLEAVDAKLDMDYDEGQLERLLVVGLWCSNMDHNQRPSIKQVLSVLNFEAPLPNLPSKMLVPTHYMPSMQDLGISYTSSSSTADTRGSRSQVSYNTDSSYSITSNKWSASGIELQPGPS